MLTSQQLAQYHAEGFLMLPRFFAEAELVPVIAEVNGLVDSLANRLYAAGKIQNRHEAEGFATRLTRLEQEFPGAAVLIHIGGILGPAVANLWATPRLLDIAEQILGPEVAGHPVWNLRSKTPNNPLTTVPWHQDTAYLADGCQHTHQLTAWIPLVDADRVNGTLQVIRGGHQSGKVVRHRLENSIGHPDSWYLYIPEAELPAGEIVTCEMPKGSVLLMNQLTPHRSTENLSESIRWSLDLRWQRPEEPSGFEGIKDCILMRTARDPNYRIDWESWARQNRIADAMLDREERADEAFSTSVSGPWMLRWKDECA
jgi:hypothetical protein